MGVEKGSFIDFWT